MALEYEGESRVVFRRGWRRWLSIKHFTALPAGSCDGRLLLELIASPEYGDDYMGYPDAGGGIHAKWWRRELSPDAYRPCSHDVVRGCLTAFADEPGKADPEKQLRFDKLLADLLDAHGSFLMMDASTEAEHEYSWVLDDFREFVWLSDARDRLRLIVAGSD